MRQLYTAIALPRMLYAADIFLPPIAVNPRHARNGKRKGGQATFTKLASIQRKAVIAISRAMSTTAGDAAEIHAGLLPFRSYVSDAQHRAALRMCTLPSTHPLSKAVKNARGRRIKTHTTRINDLIWSFELDPERIEKVEAVGWETGWKPAMEREIASTKERAIEEEARDTAEIKVFTDGSGVEGGVGAAAVLKRKGRRGWRIKRFKVGAAKQHEVFEGEAVGLVMAMDMVREEKRVREVSIYTDNQAAIAATGTDAPASAKHIIDMIHRQHRRLKRTHARAQVTIRWVPGHSDVLGNEKADEQAKWAAKGDTTAPADLPPCLRKSLPISKAAVKRQFWGKLCEAVAQAWKASPRFRKLQRIDPTFTLAHFRKTIDDMPKDQSATLVSA